MSSAVAATPAFTSPGDVMPFIADTLDNDLSGPDAIMSLLGTFWAQSYQGVDFVNDLLATRGQAEGQAVNDLAEVVAATGRADVPVYHNVNWYRLTVNQSAVTPGTVPSGPCTLAVPSGVIGAKAISEAPHYGNRLLVNGVDYKVTAGTLYMSFNPFYDASFVQTPVVSAGGTQTDVSVDLWLYGTDVDKNFVYEQFGYAIGVYMPNGEQYKKLINVVFDSLVGGETRGRLEQLFAVLCDAPLSAVDGETVTDVLTDRNNKLVITTAGVYKFNKTAPALVSVGQTLAAGTQLVDCVRVLDFDGGAVPPSLTSVSLGPGYLYGASYNGNLTWDMTSVATTVTTNVSGYTKITWPLGGDPADVTTFWNLAHTLGVAAGKTLANLLDTRPQPQPTQPTAASLPTTMVPLQFLAQNLFRFNTFVVQANTARFGPNALGVTGMSAVFRKVLSAHQGMILQVT